MFSNFAWSEMLVIACVAIIVVGPKDLPGMLRTLGKTIGSIKRMAGDFQRQVNDAIKDAELDDLKDMTSTKGFGPLEDAKKSMENFAQSINEPVEAGAQGKPSSKPAVTKQGAVTENSSKTDEKPAVKKAVRKKTSAKSAASKSTASKSAAAKKAPAKKRTAAAKAPAKSTT